MNLKITKTAKPQACKKSILLVTGGLNISKLLNFILASEYFLVIKSNGIQALTWLEEGNDPDLIITSLRMPYFDGTSLIQNLRQSGFYQDTPVMLLSEEENLAEKVSQMSFKIDSFLEKPFDPRVLKSQITKLLN